MKKNQTKKDQQSRNKKYLNSYIRYSSLAFEMIAIILIGTYGGGKLDEITGYFPLFTVSLSLLSVLTAIYLGIKDLIK